MECGDALEVAFGHFIYDVLLRQLLVRIRHWPVGFNAVQTSLISYFTWSKRKRKSSYEDKYSQAAEGVEMDAAPQLRKGIKGKMLYHARPVVWGKLRELDMHLYTSS
jgi:hypothetical protein